MAILLCRVDDRLIHGQVVVGWGAQLGLDFLAVVDDELSESEWEQDLYRAGLPHGVDARFAGTDDAIGLIPEWAGNAESGFVLTRDIGTMRRLAESGVLDDLEINLGGIHDAPGRKRVMPYLFLSDDDRRELERLHQTQITVSAQDVPTARKISLAELLELRSD
jgi:PTS system mannose-specific IIB component/fructoselysine and glucoselysine-specific PTS system IIB component